VKIAFMSDFTTPARLTSVAVYCGTNSGTDPAYAQAAASLGKTLADRGVTLVYGGGKLGLMGTVADAVLANGGEAHGVITEALREKEVAHQGLTSLQVVPTMRERKAAMAEAADAFIMLPGGYGTFEEFFEVLSATQLRIHDKPCGVLNTAGFYAALRALLDDTVTGGFVHPAHRDMVLFDEDPASLLDRLAAWTPVTASKWLDRPGAPR